MGNRGRITSRGRITIPRITEKEVLEDNTSGFEVIDGCVIVRAVSGVGGSLRSCAKGHMALRKVRDKVWEEVAHAKGRQERAVHKPG